MEPKSFLKTLSILHISLFVGLMLFSLFAYFQNGNFTANMQQEDVFIYLVPLLAATGYFASKLLFLKRVKAIKTEEKLQTKLSKYHSASLVKYALIEGPAFFALFSYYGNGNALYFVIAISLMAYLFVQRPSAIKLIKELPLTLEEKKHFDTLRNLK